MVAAPHPGEFGQGHMAFDALIPGFVGRMAGVSADVFDPLLVAGHAGVVRVFLLLVAAA